MKPKLAVRHILAVTGISLIIQNHVGPAIGIPNVVSLIISMVLSGLYLFLLSED